MHSGSRSGTHTVHETDVLMAGHWTVSAFGPIDHGGVDSVRSALDAAMSAGPSARLGLIPDDRSRTWAFEPDRILNSVREVPASTFESFGDALTQVYRHHDRSCPISITLAGDRAIFYMDHGLGDGQLLINLARLISNPAGRRGRPPQWATDAAVARPLLHAALGWYGQDPRRLLALRRRPGTPRRVYAAAPTEPWAPSVTSVFARSADGYANELRSWRTQNGTQASLSALFFTAVVRALRAENIEIDNTIKVLFNVRRYLKPTRTSLANLSAGIDLSVADAGNADDVNAAIRRTTRSGRPIANLALASAKSNIARRKNIPRPITDTYSPTEPITMTLTDLGQGDRDDAIEWTGSDRSYAAMVSPAGPNHITLAVGRTPAFNVTASFHGSVVERDAIERALNRACTDAIGLLDRSQNA